MALVRANWEPISRRYLQQAEAAKDPALASSLYGSVAELHLKYQPGDPEGEAQLRKSLELDAGNRRSGGHLERLLRAAGRTDELLELYARRAERATNRDERALAEVAAAELCQRAGRPADALAHFRKALDADPNEPRALKAVRAALVASETLGELVKVLEAAARTRRGEQDVALSAELATVLWQRLGQEEQAESFFRRIRKLDPSNRSMVEFYRAHYTARNETAAAAHRSRASAEDGVRYRAPRGHGYRDGPSGRTAAADAPKRPSTSGRACCVWQPHLPDAVVALRRLYTARRSGTPCSSS